ncbi:MAG: APC family permease [Acidobacteria bacterium]|nr:APC family permease [Acidobacteriota bacterium]
MTNVATPSTTPTEATSGRTKLVRTLGLRDLVLLNVVAVFNLNLVPPVAGSGYPSISFWIIGLLLFFLPQGIAVAEFATRFPDEGGIYIWTKKCFGEFHGFLCGWSYWTTNVFYIPTLLVYLLGIVAFETGVQDSPANASSMTQMWICVALLWAFTAISVRGLGLNKWINNAGGIAAVLTAFVLFGVGILMFVRSGGTAPPAAHEFLPNLAGWRTLSAFGVICLALVGLELGSVMGEEIREPRRDVPRATLWGGVSSGLLYLATTAILLAVLPREEISALTGILQTLERMGQSVGLQNLHRWIAVILAASICGATSAWLSGGARVPFVAGLDRYLPAWLGRIHERWHTPHMALIAQGAASTVAIVLSFAGANVRLREAYQMLLALTIVTQLIPFLYLFASLIRVAGTPGGYVRSRIKLILAGVAGFVASVAAMATAFIPPEEIKGIRIFELKLSFGTLLFLVIAIGIFYLSPARRRT